MTQARDCGAALILSIALAGCGGERVAAAKPSGLNCVEIPDGAYFQFANGRLVGVEAPEIVREMPPETERRIEAALARTGYSWIDLQWDGRIAVVRGTAPDAASRTDAYNLAKASFEADPITSGRLLQVINEIEVRESAEEIAARMNAALVAQGQGWLSVRIKDSVAILEGAAPSARARNRADRIARSIIRNDDDAVEIVKVTVDAMTVPGREPPAGTVLVDLDTNPNLIACQNAFFEAMRGRQIEYTPGESAPTNASVPLLDAIAGIAQLCRGFEIEIAQHAGGGDDAADAMDLSQRRASAVRDYLSAYGASRDLLFARGYGVTQPLDTANTEDARERNQRTEFTVRAPRD